MSDHILEACRRKHWLAAKTEFRPEYESSRGALETHLFKHGVLVWGCVVKANEALYAQGTIDLRGCVVFSFDSYFDERAEELEAIGTAVFEVGQVPSQDPEVKQFARIVSEDNAVISRSAVPSSLTEGRKVWYEEIFFVRSRLPGGCLSGRLLPIIVAANPSSGAMVPPLTCWADELANDWTSKVASKRAHIGDATLPVSAEEFLTNPLALTRAAAKELQRVIAQQRLKHASLRVGHERGAYSMDLVEAMPGPDDLSYNSLGMGIVINRKCARALMGIELDFKGGYSFRKRAVAPSSTDAPKSWWTRLRGG